MGESVIGVPELTVSVANTTEKEISAIQFYAIPYDVYGDEITGWTSQKNLYTDAFESEILEKGVPINVTE